MVRKLKVLIVFLVSFALATMNMTPLVASETVKHSAQLTDISGNPYEDIINEWVDKGYVKGNPDKTFKPNGLVTRAEMMAFINRAWKFTETTKTNFKDIKYTDWYYSEVGKATKAGYIEGYNGKINPKANITRQEFAMMLVRLGKLEEKVDEKQLSKMQDQDQIPEWSQGAISACLKQGFFKDFAKDKFVPTQNVSRVEAVVVLNRLLTYLNGDKEKMIAVPVTSSSSSSSSNHRADDDESVLDTISGTAYSSNQKALINEKLTFESNSQSFNIQTDETGYFTAHIKVNETYKIIGKDLEAKISSNGEVEGIKLENIKGEIVLGKILENADNKVVLQSGVIYMNESQNVTYDANQAIIEGKQDIIAGDIIILPPNEKNIAGLAVKVESIDFSNGKTVIGTSTPTIQEVYQSIKGNVEVEVSPEYLEVEPGVEMYEQQHAKRNNGGLNAVAAASTFTDLESTKTYVLKAGEGNWKFNGSLEFKGTAKVNINWGGWRRPVDAFDVNLKSTQTLKGELTYSIATPEDFEKKIAAFNIPTSVPGLSVYVPIKLVGSANGETTITTTVKATETIGVKYETNDGMRVYPEDKFQMDATQPVITANGEARIGLSMEESLAVFGIGIVGLEEGAGLYLEGAANSAVGHIVIIYGVYGEIKAIVPIIDWESESFEKKIELGRLEFGDEDMNDFRVLPAQINLKPGQMATFTLQKKDNYNNWIDFTPQNYADLEFNSENTDINYVGQGEIKVADHAQGKNSVVKFTLNGVTKTATIKISKEYGGLQGVVKDAESGLPLADAHIILYDGTFDTNQEVITGNSGTFTMEVPSGSSYHVIINKDNYIAVSYEDISISKDQVTYLETVLQIGNTHIGNGVVKGQVVNALDNNGVAGLTIQVRAGMNNRVGTVVATTQTDTQGNYELNNLLAGNYTAEVNGEGYNTAYFTIVCIGGQVRTDINAAVTPTLSEGSIRIVLRWDEIPHDLDSHLTGPDGNNSRFHIYYSNKQYGSYANLDLDDTTSFGPETTTIVQQLQGVYRFTVHDFTNRNSSSSSQLSNSGAKVEVYKGSTQIATYYVPTNQVGNVWTVFELNGTTITPINQISTSLNGASAIDSRARFFSLRAAGNEEDLFSDLPSKEGETPVEEAENQQTGEESLTEEKAVIEEVPSLEKENTTPVLTEEDMQSAAESQEVEEALPSAEETQEPTQPAEEEEIQEPTQIQPSVEEVPSPVEEPAA